MTDETNYVGPDEARAALAAVAEVERAGRIRSARPRWFGVVMAFLLGGLVATPALADAEGLVSKELATIVLILGFALVVAGQRQRADAWPQDFPGGNGQTALALTITIGLSLALYAIGIVLRDAADLWWGPLASGVVAVALVFLLVNRERRSMLAPIDRTLGMTTPFGPTVMV